MSERLTPDQNKLVEENVPLARYLANVVYRKSQDTLDVEELQSNAFLGLLRAAQRWDADGPVPFSVFARKHILGRMTDSQRKEDHVPKEVRRDFKTLQKLGYSGRFTKEHPIEYYMQETGLTEKRILHVTTLVSHAPVYLEDTREYGDDAQVVKNDPESSENVEASVLVSQAMKSNVNALKTLTFEQQVVISLRYHQDLEFQEVAERMNCSIAYVRLQHSEAVVTLHKAIAGKLTETNS